MHDELVASETGSAGERQLPRRGDVGSDALFPQQAQDRHIGECFGPERDMPASDRRLQRSGSGSKSVLTIDDEGRAELLRESGRTQPAEREIRPLDAGRVREQAEQAVVSGSFAHLRHRGGRGVSVPHLLKRERLVVRGVAGLAEITPAGGNQLLHGGAGGLEVVARVELLGRFR